MAESVEHEEKPLVLNVSAARIWVGQRPKTTRPALEKETGRMSTRLTEGDEAKRAMRAARLNDGSQLNGRGMTHERYSRREGENEGE